MASARNRHCANCIGALSFQYDLDEPHISTDQRAKGNCCQSECDPGGEVKEGGGK